MRTTWLIPTALLISGVAIAQPDANKEKPPPSEDGKPAPIEPTERPDREQSEALPPAPPVGPEVKPTDTPAEVPDSSKDVASAPLPGQEHGRLDTIDEGDSVGRKIGRGLLWIPRLPVELVIQPIRGVLYIKEKYNALQVITDIFTSDDRKIAVFPTALVETGFGLNVGARATFSDLLGEGEKLKLRAGTGGRWATVLAAEINTGRIIPGPISLGVEARYEKKNNERFFGYGNGDDTNDLPGMPVDPNMDMTAVDTRYQITVARIAPALRVQLSDFFVATLTGSYTHRDTQDDPDELSATSVSIGEVYDTTRINGFDNLQKHIYSELELSYDTRRAGDIYDPTGMRTAGGLLMGFAGRENAVSDGDKSYYRFGVDLQKIIRLFGPRTLQLRAYGETVTGDREDIPFFGLTRLGGQYLLRGYERDRFRDKTAAVLQAAYVFPLSDKFAGSLFVDAGRVFSGLKDLSVKDPRVGYGGALELYGSSSLILRAELASSIDGGLMGYISLDNAFDAQARVDRR